MKWLGSKWLRGLRHIIPYSVSVTQTLELCKAHNALCHLSRALRALKWPANASIHGATFAGQAYEEFRNKYDKASCASRAQVLDCVPERGGSLERFKQFANDREIVVCAVSNNG